MQLQTLISNRGPFKVTNKSDLSRLVNALLQTEVEEIEEEYINELDGSLKEQRKKIAMDLVNALNSFERMHPRNDPALRALNTAQWKAYIYAPPKGKGGYIRDKRGRFTFNYRVQIWNMQRPFPYRFDFANMEDPSWRGGRLLLNMPIESMTKKEKTWVLRRTGMLPDDGRLKKTKYGDFYAQKGQKDSYERQGQAKVGGRRDVVKRGNTTSRYVGNLAAVRLSQTTGTVRPKFAQRIVFWNNGYARKLDKSGNRTAGRPYKMGGYVFTLSRRKTGNGHEWYYNNIMNILDMEVDGWIDNIWQK